MNNSYSIYDIIFPIMDLSSGQIAPLNQPQISEIPEIELQWFVIVVCMSPY